MYKLLIVDDEEIEREGMAQFISWPDYDIELVGTAGNGVEGFELIQSRQPDIVLTDIKMPVMDGLEMIKRSRASFPEVEFIILSGYGEFEFTSKAMEEGIRHYILKPCDEEKISRTLALVKEEIELRRQTQKQHREYESTVKKLLPKARAQVFRSMLLGQEQLMEDYSLFLAERGEDSPGVFVLALQTEAGFDYLEQFVLENVLNELLNEQGLVASAGIQQMVLFLLEETAGRELPAIIGKLRQEFKRFKPDRLLAAVSEPGETASAGAMYQEVQELLRMGQATQGDELLRYELFREQQNEAEVLTDYQKIRAAGHYGDILFEFYLAFMKMRILEYSFSQKLAACRFMLKVLWGETGVLDDFAGSEWELLVKLTDTAAARQGKKEEGRLREILQAVYAHIGNPDLSIQFLAKEVLFMNEDYFGRFFYRNMGEKFSAFLLKRRVELAKRIIRGNLEIKIGELGEMLGFAPDGQYFSKTFRKITGMSPREYKAGFIDQR